MKLGEIFEKPGKPLMTLMTSQYNEEEIIPAPFVYRDGDAHGLLTFAIAIAAFGLHRKL